MYYRFHPTTHYFTEKSKLKKFEHRVSRIGPRFEPHVKHDTDSKNKGVPNRIVTLAFVGVLELVIWQNKFAASQERTVELF